MKNELKAFPPPPITPAFSLAGLKSIQEEINALKTDMLPIQKTVRDAYNTADWDETTGDLKLELLNVAHAINGVTS